MCLCFFPPQGRNSWNIAPLNSESIEKQMSENRHGVVAFDDAFPNSHAICSAFFTQPEANIKNWMSMDTLVTSDESTFWTVMATHPKLPIVVDQLVRAVDESHATASKLHRVPRTQEELLLKFLVRAMTTLVSNSGSGPRYSIASVALRYTHIFPSSLLLPISLMLLRASGPISSTAIASFLLISPVALTHLTSVTAMWYDSVTQIATKCVTEAKRGRFQRRAGDILPLLERTYRITKHMWALLNAAPYLVDYTDIRRVMLGLRIVMDIISPQIQHFVMSSDELAPRRPQLTKANAMILNAAVGAATLATIFFSFSTDAADEATTRGPTGRGGRKSPAKKCIAEDVMKRFEESCSAYILQYCPGNAAALVERNRNLRDIFHSIEQPPSQAEGASDDTSTGTMGTRLASFFEWANGHIPNSNDFLAGLVEGEERLGTCLIVELVHQGFHVETLHAKGFLNMQEATMWGARRPTQHDASSSTAAVHDDGDPQPQVDAAARPSEPMPSGDPAVDMVLSVLPHFTANLAQSALAYYHGDVEQLINDALCGNLAPHLQSELAALELSEQHHKDPPAALPAIRSEGAAAFSSSKINNEEDMGVTPEGDMERFVSSHYADDNDDDGDDDTNHSTMLTTVHGHASELPESLYMDEGFREHTFEFLYEDERDDGNDGEAHVWGAVGAADSVDENSSEDEMHDLRPLNKPVPGGVVAAQVPQHASAARNGRRPDHHKGKAHRGGTGDSGAHGDPAGAAGARPAYATKKTKERKGGGGGGAKSALQRSVKRSGFE
jgi:hypothetical protein